METSSETSKKGSQTPQGGSTRRPPLSPKVRGVVDHPLNNNGEGPDRTPVPSAYTASLVQSAAKSVLDTSTSVVSDDDDSTTSIDVDFRLSSPMPPSSPSLLSLQTKTLPALPDEQDRKRFIGCLAAVLASSYDYDYEDEDDLAVSASESFASLDDDDHENDVLEPTLSYSNTHSSSEYATEDSQNEVDTEGWNQKQDRRPQRTSQRQTSEGDMPLAPAKGRQPSVRRNQRHRNEKKAHLATLARNRHRQRRYQLFSNLLLSASESLMLDKSQAKAFTPMLTRLLAPRPSAQSTKTSSSIENDKRRQRLLLRRKSQGNRKSRTMPTEEDASASFVEKNGIPRRDVSLPPVFGTDEMDRDPFWTWDLNGDDSLRPFLESLTPGSGLRCLSLLLLHHLLHSQEGYDARIRHVFKKLGVVVLAHEMECDEDVFLPDDDDDAAGKDYDGLVDRATRKFEALEHCVAWKLLHLSSQQPEPKTDGTAAGSDGISGASDSRRRSISRNQLVRGLKIGSAGIVAGTLFAVTGGLAAPGIAAGVAAIAGSTAATAAVVTLTSTAAVTAIFGVGGGGLAAYKMQRRTQGLTEFEFQKESGVERGKDGRRVQPKVEAELFSTICLSGWLRDKFDFQRPWGVTPSNPRLTDRLELLERFYAVHKPEYVSKCSRILAKWKGEEKELWRYLRQKYGSDPAHLFPLRDGPRRRATLTHEQSELLDTMLLELGFAPSKKSEDEHQKVPFEKIRTGWRERFMHREQQAEISTKRRMQTPKKSGTKVQGIKTPLVDSLHGPHDVVPPTPDFASSVSTGVESTLSSSSAASQPKEEIPDKDSPPPKHVATVWDYQANYGGELYTIKWESQLLLELSDSVNDMAFDMVGGATTQILKQTALSTLLSAVAWPYALINAANMIDGTWTLAIERSEEAGKELARSLLFSRAGHRPVTLVGFSMGARTIYSCLKELARYQEEWEEIQNRKLAACSSRTGHFKNSYNDTEDVPNMQEIFENMREPASIVEDAILMGTPNHLSLSSWIACRQVVAGRLVNCYSRKDLVLSLMFQFKRLSGGLKAVCGTCPVEVHGVENVDVSDLVSSHQDYCLVAGDILKRVRHGQPLRHPQCAIVVNGEK